MEGERKTEILHNSTEMATIANCSIIYMATITIFLLPSLTFIKLSSHSAVPSSCFITKTIKFIHFLTLKKGVTIYSVQNTSKVQTLDKTNRTNRRQSSYSDKRHNHICSSISTHAEPACGEMSQNTATLSMLHLQMVHD